MTAIIQESAETKVARNFHLPPFPTGWYCLVPSAELAVGAALRKRFAGHEVVVFRGESGRVSAMDAYFPHMGAHMGYGGKVVGDSLRCPFHGFEFDHTGECVRTPYGTLPSPRCVVRSWPVDEANGFVFIYHQPRGEPPTWRIPQLDMRPYSAVLTRSWPLESHPQETTENSVDTGHFTSVHGYEAFEVVEPLTTNGPHLRAAYAFTRPAGMFRKKGAALRVEIEVDVFGLGYSVVQTSVPHYRLNALQWVLPTPTDAGKIDFRIALCSAPGTGGPLSLLPRNLARFTLAHAAFRSYCRDVSADFEVWDHKIYVDPPLLARGDGPVMRYRHWARQFYD